MNDSKSESKIYFMSLVMKNFISGKPKPNFD